MRLRTRIAGLAVAIALVPVLFTSLRAVSIATSEASAASAQILVRDADAMASFIDTWTKDQARAVAGLLQVFPVEKATEAEQEGLVQAAFLAVPTVQIAVLVDADGAPIVEPLFLTETPPEGSVLEDRVPGSDARADVLVASLPLSEALAGRSRMASGVVGDLYSLEGIVAVPVAATGPYDEQVLLGAEVSLGELADEVAARSTNEHGVAVMDSEGAVVLGTGHPLIDPDILAPLLRSRASVSYSLADGTEVRGAVAPLGMFGGAVVVVEPATVAERAGTEIRSRTAWTAVLAVLFATALGVLVAQSLSRPIDRLRYTALAVADGEFGKRLHVNRSDEIGELARAFNHMSMRLEHNRVSLASQKAEIEAFNVQLQQRVDDATAELRRAQEQLLRSGRLAAVTDVSAGLAHELNNPLAGILGLAQVLRAQAEEAGEVSLLGKIEEQAERCREVVSAMTRLSADDMGPTAGAVVDLHDVLRELLVVVRSSLRQRGVTVELAARQYPAPVRVDSGFAVRALSPVFTTLFSALPQGSVVMLDVSRADETVSLTLTADQPIAADALRDDRRATGLGLWVSRQLLAGVGGTLNTPEAPAQTWTVTLPEAV